MEADTSLVWVKTIKEQDKQIQDSGKTLSKRNNSQKNQREFLTLAFQGKFIGSTDDHES